MAEPLPGHTCGTPPSMSCSACMDLYADPGDPGNLPEANTNRELYREDTGNPAGSFYEDHVFLTADGLIGMCVAGFVIVQPIADWHSNSEHESGRRVYDRPGWGETVVPPIKANPAWVDDGNVRARQLAPCPSVLTGLALGQFCACGHLAEAHERDGGCSVCRAVAGMGLAAPVPLQPDPNLITRPARGELVFQRVLIGNGVLALATLCIAGLRVAGVM